MRLFYVVAYDVPCSKRRKKISDWLEGYGQRVQYSVFECVLLPKHYQELVQGLMKRLDEQEDKVRIYPLSAHTRDNIHVVGGPPLAQMPMSKVI